MVITYYGLSCHKIQFGNAIIAFNPISKQSLYKSSSFGADIGLISSLQPDYNGREQIAYGSRDPFVIDGPGEYEINGIYVRGMGVSQAGLNDSKKETETNIVNTVYSVLFEGINLCHLGALRGSSLSPEVTEALGEIDVLFVPIHGPSVMSPAEGAKVATLLAPKLIIPMYVGVHGAEKNLLSQFLKESGGESSEPVDKLTLKKKDLEGKEGDAIVITPVG